jgi:hypothetical protein
MMLTTVERERITDSMLKIQSVRASLDQMDEAKIPHVEEIESCLDSADHHLKVALGYARPKSEVDTRGVRYGDDETQKG